VDVPNTKGSRWVGSKEREVSTLSPDAKNVNVNKETRTLHVFVDGGFVAPSCYPMMQPIISDPPQPAQHKVSNLFTSILWVN